MESEQAILALAALAQSTRLDVFRLLVKHEPEGLAAGDIAKALAVPQNTMSSHLAILSRAGLVTARRFSRSIVYRADLKAFQAVVLFMLRDCCDGRPEICAPLIEEPHAMLSAEDKEESACLIASTTFSSCAPETPPVRSWQNPSCARTAAATSALSPPAASRRERSIRLRSRF